jgi:hypothetical protein
VRLQRLSSGKWIDVTSAETSSTGVASFPVTRSRKTSYRVRFSGVSGVYAAATSSVVVVTPKVSLGAPMAPERMKRYRYYTVRGSLKPRHAAGTRPVRIYRYKKVSGKWKRYGTYLTARVYDYKTYSRYKVTMRLYSKGSWRIRAYAPADSRHAATWSKYDYVTVY